MLKDKKNSRSKYKSENVANVDLCLKRGRYSVCFQIYSSLTI